MPYLSASCVLAASSLILSCTRLFAQAKAVSSSVLLSSITMKRIDLVKTGGFEAGEHLMVADVSPPSPGAGQVVIQVQASAINPVDWKMAEYGFLLPDSLPAALGCDVAGVVQASDDSALQGKRVVTYLGASKASHPTDRGAFVEQVAMDADLVVELPDDLSMAEAASLPVGALTAELLLKELTAVSSKAPYVLIWGASSSVGYNCVQLAKRRGWKPIAVASGKHQAFLNDVGAVAFVDYRKDDVVNKIKEICGSNIKLNGAVDCIGDPTTFGTCAQLVKELGDPASAGLAVSTVMPMGLPEPPQGVEKCPVDLGLALENAEQRALIQKWLPEMVKLKPMPIRSVKGTFTAKTVQEAFQISKDGVSGEKLVIEWINND